MCSTLCTADVDAALGADERFDVVTLFNVLDRCDQPVSLLRSLRARLRDGRSRLVLAVPLPLRPAVESGSEVCRALSLPLSPSNPPPPSPPLPPAHPPAHPPAYPPCSGSSPASTWRRGPATASSTGSSHSSTSCATSSRPRACRCVPSRAFRTYPRATSRTPTTCSTTASSSCPVTTTSQTPSSPQPPSLPGPRPRAALPTGRAHSTTLSPRPLPRPRPRLRALARREVAKARCRSTKFAVFCDLSIGSSPISAYILCGFRPARSPATPTHLAPRASGSTRSCWTLGWSG